MQNTRSCHLAVVRCCWYWISLPGVAQFGCHVLPSWQLVLVYQLHYSEKWHCYLQSQSYQKEFYQFQKDLKRESTIISWFRTVKFPTCMQTCTVHYLYIFSWIQLHVVPLPLYSLWMIEKSIIGKCTWWYCNSLIEEGALIWGERKSLLNFPKSSFFKYIIDT